MLNWNYLSSDAVAKALKVKKSAQRDGVENYPKSSSKRLSVKEQEIIAKCKKHFSEQANRSIDGCRPISEKLGSYNSKTKANGLKDFLRESERKLEKIFFDAKLEISSQKKEMERVIAECKEEIDLANKEKQRFIVEKDIPKREPKKRTFLKLFGSLLLIAIMAGLEVYLNFNALIEAIGYFESQVLAAIISAINIGLSFIVGVSVIRYLLNDPSRTAFEKAFDRLKVIGYTCLLVYSNFLIAATRAAEPAANRAAGLEGSEIAAAQTFEEVMSRVIWPFQPEVLATFQGPSIYLILLGFFFAIISLLDGYYFDDKIPGFGAIGRNLEKAKKRLSSEQKTRAERLKNEYQKRKDILFSAKETTFNELKAREQSRLQAAEEWSLLQDEMQIAVNDYDVFLKDLENTQDELIEMYRGNNSENRSSDDPIYFKESSDKTYLKTFEQVHTNIFYELVLSDAEKVKKWQEFQNIIHKENELAVQELVKISDKYKNELEAIIK